MSLSRSQSRRRSRSRSYNRAHRRRSRSRSSCRALKACRGQKIHKGAPPCSRSISRHRKRVRASSVSSSPRVRNRSNQTSNGALGAAVARKVASQVDEKARVSKKKKKESKKERKAAKKAKKAANKLKKAKKALQKAGKKASKKGKHGSSSSSSSSTSSSSSSEIDLEFVLNKDFGDSGASLDPRNPDRKIQRALGLGKFSFAERKDDEAIAKEFAKVHSVGPDGRPCEDQSKDWWCQRMKGNGQACNARNFVKNEKCMSCGSLRPIVSKQVTTRSTGGGIPGEAEAGKMLERGRGTKY